MRSVTKEDWKVKGEKYYMYAYDDTAPARHASPLAGRHRYR